MDLIAVGRVLWSKRWLVLLSVLLAGAVGAKTSFNVKLAFPPKLSSKQHLVGQAAAQVLIDTPMSQIADVATQNDPNLYSQANLLADVMATAPVRQSLTSSLAIPADELAITPPPSSIAVPIRASPLALAGEKLPASGSWTLAVSVDPSLPIIGFSAVAPTQVQAGNLVTAAIAVLRQRLEAIDLEQRIPAREQLVVNPIDPTSSAPLAVGSEKVKGVIAAILVLFMFNFVMVMVVGMRRRRREPRAQEPYRPIDPALAELAIQAQLQAVAWAAAAGGADPGSATRQPPDRALDTEVSVVAESGSVRSEEGPVEGAKPPPVSIESADQSAAKSAAPKPGRTKKPRRSKFRIRKTKQPTGAPVESAAPPAASTLRVLAQRQPADPSAEDPDTEAPQSTNPGAEDPETEGVLDAGTGVSFDWLSVEGRS